MMFSMTNLKIISVLALGLFLSACKNSKDIYKGLTAAQIYEQAEKNMAKENYHQATKDFEALEARFPYGEYSDKAQLGLMTAYYKHNDYPLATSAADRFIRMNPYHPKVDYAYYLKGLIKFDQNYTFTYKYLPLDKSARDPSTAQAAFEAFKELAERFPKSEFIPDAKKRMIFLRNQLASYELQVVEYYIKRGAFLSAVNRANYIVKHYEKTPAIPKALAAMVMSYRKLGMNKLAEDSLKILKDNYPESIELNHLR